MNISIAIMSHPDRSKEAESLYNRLSHMQFSSIDLVFDSENNEWKNGETCLRKGNDSDWHIIIQDDAIISDNFYENVKNAILNVPDKSLISFYTGTVRPMPHRVKRAVESAATHAANWLYSDNLFWGVCIALPREYIEKLLAFTQNRKEVYDRRIGTYFYINHLPIYYTNPSLVDHDYTLKSLTGHDYNTEPRKAHQYEPLIIKNWNNQAIQI